MKIKSIISCLPSTIHHNEDLPFDADTIKKVSESSGIKSRRIADRDTTASDLCVHAAEAMMKASDVGIEEIGVLVFVSQYPDYILPSTAHIIKEKLGLSTSTIAIQINEGCSGYIYGLQVCKALMQSSDAKYGILLAGDTTSKVIEDTDTATRPIFSDAGSATLLSDEAGEIKIELGSDGKGYKDIIVEAGGFRNSDSDSSSISLKMDGMNVFMFAISKIPKYINRFLDKESIKIEDIDYIVLHQANKMMNERIIRKLGIEENKALYSLEDFGNTSSASIPLTITHNLKSHLSSKKQIVACGFGVGLSWGTAHFSLDENCHLETINY